MSIIPIKSKRRSPFAFLAGIPPGLQNKKIIIIKHSKLKKKNDNVS